MDGWTDESVWGVEKESQPFRSIVAYMDGGQNKNIQPITKYECNSRHLNVPASSCDHRHHHPLWSVCMINRTQRFVFDKG